MNYGRVVDVSSKYLVAFSGMLPGSVSAVHIKKHTEGTKQNFKVVCSVSELYAV